MHSVDYENIGTDELGWLRDRDDWPIMQTALAAHADILVTDDATDFPLGEIRNGILILGSPVFLQRLYDQVPEAEANIRALVSP